MNQSNESDFHRKIGLGLQALHRPLIVALRAVSESIGCPVERRQLDADGRRHGKGCKSGAVVLEHELDDLDAESPPYVLGHTEEEQIVDLLGCERKMNQ